LYDLLLGLYAIYARLSSLVINFETLW